MNLYLKPNKAFFKINPPPETDNSYIEEKHSKQEIPEEKRRALKN